ncbi:MAG: DUF3990 domain-containing protein [Coriobacteriales bacterium]|jgi:hypothetical protein|nr:DUF3990 domain-containing protein [Coriobacteriales bacterium]
MSRLVLYHGSNRDFASVSLDKSRDRRDFGKGFYTTTIKSQAEQWANNLRTRYGGQGRFLYVFEFDWSDELKYKVFEGLNLEWLEMVRENRMLGGLQHASDVVRGPVANDDTMPTLALYVDGLLSADAALTQLAYFKANDQVSLHTTAALSRLRMTDKVLL